MNGGRHVEGRDASVAIGRDAVGNVIVTGDGNTVEVQLTVIVADTRLQARDAASLDNPYRGLDAFRETDSALFFGREDAVRRLWTKFHLLQRGPSPRLLPILGGSGSGKSSLVRAGLLAELVRQPMEGMRNPRVLVLRPGANPLQRLVDVLARIAPPDGWGAVDTVHRAAWAHGNPDTRVILFVDQLEEVFTECTSELARNAFLSTLAHAASQPDGLVSVIFAMRNDFAGALRAHEAFAVAVREQRFTVSQMSRDQLVETIEKPASLLGQPWPSGLVENLVLQCEGRAGALPLLQFALKRLWSEHLAGRLAESRWSSRLIEDFVVQVAETLFDGGGDASHRDAAQRIIQRAFMAMVQLGEGTADTRRVARLSELVARRETSAQVRGALAPFLAPEARLVTASELDGEPAYELAHEALIGSWDRLRGWLGHVARKEDAEAIRNDVRLRRRLRQATDAWQRDRTALLRPPELELAARLRDRAPDELSEPEHALIKASLAAWYAHARWRRRVLGVGAVAVTAAAIGFGLQARALREEQAKTQHSISEAVKVEKLIVFELDSNLRAIAGASRIRDTLLQRSRNLLTELRRAGELDDSDQRTVMLGEIARGDLAVERGHLQEAQTLYLEALVEAQRIVSTEPDNQDAKHDLALLYGKLGVVATSAGKRQDANDWFVKAVPVLEALVDKDPKVLLWQRDLSFTYDALDKAAIAAGRLDDARGWIDKRFATAQRLAIRDPDNLEWQSHLSTTYDDRGVIAMAEGKMEDARTWFGKVLEDRKIIVDKAPGDARFQSELAGAYARLGDVATEAGTLSDARAWYEKARVVLKMLVDRDPLHAQWQSGLALCDERLGTIAETEGKLGEAHDRFEKSFAGRQALVVMDPSNTDYQRDLGVAYSKLADVARSADKFEDAHDWFTKELALADSLMAKDAGNPQWQEDVAVAYSHLGDVALRSKKFEDARGWFTKALAIYQPLAAADPNNVGWQRRLSTTYDNLGRVATAAYKFDDARPWYEKALAIEEPLAAKTPGNSEVQRDLALSYQRFGYDALGHNDRDAQRWFEKMIAIRETLVAKDPGNTKWQYDLAQGYDAFSSVASPGNKLDVQRGWIDKELAVEQRLIEIDPHNTSWQNDQSEAHQRLGDIERQAGKLADAKASYGRALAIVQLLARAAPGVLQWQQRIAILYGKFGEVASAAGELDDARGWFDRALSTYSHASKQDYHDDVLQHGLAEVYGKLASRAKNANNFDEARDWLAKSMARHKALITEEPDDPEWQFNLALNEQSLGELETAARKLDDARGWFEQALSLNRSLVAAHPDNATWRFALTVDLDRLAGVASAVGKPGDTRTWIDQALTIAIPLVERNPKELLYRSTLAELYLRLAMLALDAGALEESRAWTDQIIAMHRNNIARDPGNTKWQPDLCISLLFRANMARSAQEAKPYLNESRDLYQRLQHDDAVKGPLQTVGKLLQAHAQHPFKALDASAPGGPSKPMDIIELVRRELMHAPAGAERARALWAIANDAVGGAQPLADATAMATIDGAIQMLEAATADLQTADDRALWANLQDALGSAREQRASRTHADADWQAVIAAYERAQTVHTRAQRPDVWARERGEIALAQSARGAWSEAAAAAMDALSVNHADAVARGVAVNAYHDHLFEYVEAERVAVAWSTQHPDDLSAACEASEAKLTNGRFAETRADVDSLMTNSKLPITLRVPLQALALVAAVGQGDAQAIHVERDELELLAAWFARRGNTLTWSFAGTEHFIASDARFAAERGFLISILQAIDAHNMAALRTAIAARKRARG